MLLLYQVATAQGCHSQIVEFQDDNKLLEQLVASLLNQQLVARDFLLPRVVSNGKREERTVVDDHLLSLATRC